MKRIVEFFKNIFKDKNAKLGVTVLVLLLTIVGATYAYLTLTVNTYNDVYLGNTFCFDINYNIENDNNTLPITGTLWPSALPNGGLSGKVSINISNSCPVLGLGSLFLNVSDTTSSTLVQTVPAHCENSQTLETMKEYTTSEACTAQTNGVWVTNGSALKYAVYNTNDTTSVLPLSVGYINKKGSIGIYENFDVTHTLANYYIYVWLDGELSDNSYAMLSFDGYVSAQVVQSGLISDSGGGENDNRLYNVASVGNFVNYNDDTWAVLYKENESVYIISLSSIGSVSFYTLEGSNLTSILSPYCNTSYVADGVCSYNTMFVFDDTSFRKFTYQYYGVEKSLLSCYQSSQNEDCGYYNQIIDMGDSYWFDNNYNGQMLYYYWDGDNSYVNAAGEGNSYGIRPIIKLDSSVLSTGGTGEYQDPFLISERDFDDSGESGGDSGESGDVEVIDNSWTEDFADTNIISQLTISAPQVGTASSYCSWGVNTSAGVFSSHNCNNSLNQSLSSIQETATITFNVPNDGNIYNLTMTTMIPTVTTLSQVSSYSIVLYDANDTEFTTPLYTFYEYSTITFSQLKTGISLGLDAPPPGDYTILLTYMASGNYPAYIDDLALTKAAS